MAAEHLQPHIKSDEILIHLKRAENNRIDFSVLMSDTNAEDPNVELDVKVLAAIATGMITFASKSSAAMFNVGIKVLDGVKDLNDPRYN